MLIHPSYLKMDEHFSETKHLHLKMDEHFSETKHLHLKMKMLTFPKIKDDLIHLPGLSAQAKHTGLLRNPANFQPLIPAWTRNAVHVRTGFLDDVYQRKIHICTVHAMLEQSQASNCPETAQKRFLFRIPEDNLLSLVSPYTRSCVRIFRIPPIR